MPYDPYKSEWYCALHKTSFKNKDSLESHYKKYLCLKRQIGQMALGIPSHLCGDEDEWLEFQRRFTEYGTRREAKVKPQS